MQEQRGLVAEEAVEAGLGDADGAGDALHVHGLVALGPEQFDRLVERRVRVEAQRAAGQSTRFSIVYHVVRNCLTDCVEH